MRRLLSGMTALTELGEMYSELGADFAWSDHDRGHAARVSTQVLTNAPNDSRGPRGHSSLPTDMASLGYPIRTL